MSIEYSEGSGDDHYVPVIVRVDGKRALSEIMVNQNPTEGFHYAIDMDTTQQFELFNALSSGTRAEIIFGTSNNVSREHISLTNARNAISKARRMCDE